MKNFNYEVVNLVFAPVKSILRILGDSYDGLTAFVNYQVIPPAQNKNTTGCDNLGLSSGQHSEKENLAEKIRIEFGNNYTVADWADLKSIQNIDLWISCMGLKKGQTFMVTKNGNFKTDGTRQYYVHYSPSGLPYSGFEVHDQISNKLFLGSWYGLNQNILFKTN